jgi:hypothetical protein
MPSHLIWFAAAMLFPAAHVLLRRKQRKEERQNASMKRHLANTYPEARWTRQ